MQRVIPFGTNLCIKGLLYGSRIIWTKNASQYPGSETIVLVTEVSMLQMMVFHDLLVQIQITDIFFLIVLAVFAGYPAGCGIGTVAVFAVAWAEAGTMLSNRF